MQTAMDMILVTEEYQNEGRLCKFLLRFTNPDLASTRIFYIREPESALSIIFLPAHTFAIDTLRVNNNSYYVSIRAEGALRPRPELKLWKKKYHGIIAWVGGSPPRVGDSFACPAQPHRSTHLPGAKSSISIDNLSGPTGSN